MGTSSHILKVITTRLKLSLLLQVFRLVLNAILLRMRWRGAVNRSRERGLECDDDGTCK